MVDGKIQVLVVQLGALWVVNTFDMEDAMNFDVETCSCWISKIKISGLCQGASKAKQWSEKSRA